jgi:hypothetical protein
MALAFLLSQLRRVDPKFKIGDNPYGGIAAFVVDHQLREDSARESEAVVEELKKLRVPSPRRAVLPLGRNEPVPRPP